MAEVKVLQLRNRHPVDELADIRAAKKRAEEQEAELLNLIRSEQVGLIGSDYEAKLVPVKQTRIDMGKLRDRFSKAELEPFMKSSEGVRVVLQLRSEEDQA